MIEDPLALTVGPLTVRFTRSGDRYSHAISWQEQAAWLTTVEGDGLAHWPPSPAFQQASPGPNGSILLVGMAGRSHWSAVVEPAGERGVRFDLACRVQERPDWLGGTYLLAPAWTIAAAQTDAIDFAGPQGECVRLAAEGDLGLETSFDNTLVTLDLSQAVGYEIDATTLRWRYRFEPLD